MKTAIRHLLPAAVAAIILPLSALAFSETVNGVQWLYSVSSLGAFVRVDKPGPNGAVEIPSSLGGYSVYGISDQAFYPGQYLASGLTSIGIPVSVRSIGTEAFMRCTSLRSVNIAQSSGRFTIGSGAFSQCSRLKSITLPDGLASIGEEAFSGCAALTSIALPSGVTSIGAQAFSGCAALTSIALPSGVTRIENSTFYGCSGLTSVTVSDSVTTIGEKAFYGCSSLGAISIPHGVTRIENSTFAECTNIAAMTIPNNIRSIGNRAFDGCSRIKSVAIPDSVTSIGQQAFQGCTGLTSVAIGNGVTSIGGWAFYGCSGLLAFSVGSNNPNYSSHGGLLLTKDGTTLLHGINGDVTIPDGLTSIEVRAFGGCRGLTSIVIPGSVTHIKGAAFENCRELKSVTIEDGVTRIGDFAFSNCSGLKTLSIPGSVANIEYNAFENCTGLETLYLPSRFEGKTASMSIPEGCQLVFFCQVPLDHAGGIGGTASVTATNGVAMPAITLPTREGYAFGGYFTAANGGGTQYYTASGAAARNWDLSETATLYAKWTKNPDDASSSGTAVGTGQTLPAYTIAFNANAKGVKGKMSAQKIAYGKAAKLRKNVFTRSGYVFIGWAVSKGGAVAYANGATVKNLRKDGKTTTLYAVWAKPKYKVAFYANGGKGKMAVLTLKYGKAAKLAANKFKAPKGCMFAGWAKSKDDAKKGKVAFKNTAKVKNLTATGKTVKLYAVWKKK